MKRIRKTLAAALAVFLFALTGCAGGDTTWAYEYEGNKMPAGVYINYQMLALSTAENKLADANAENESYEHPSSVKALLQANLDGVTIAQYIREEAAALAREYYLTEKMFAEKELLYDASSQAAAQNASVSLWNASADTYEANGVAKSSIDLYYDNESKKNLLFHQRYGEGGDSAIAEADLKAYFADQYAKADILFVGIIDAESPETGTVDEQRSRLMQKAEVYAERLKSGEDIEQLIYEVELEEAGDDAESQASIAKPEKGSLTYIQPRAPGNALIEGMFAATVGEPYIMESSNVIYIIQRHDILADPVDLAQYSSSLVYDWKYDEFSEWFRGLANELVLTENQSALDLYQPEKLKVK